MSANRDKMRGSSNNFRKEKEQNKPNTPETSRENESKSNNSVDVSGGSRVRPTTRSGIDSSTNDTRSRGQTPATGYVSRSENEANNEANVVPESGGGPGGGFGGQAPVSVIPAAVGGGKSGFASGNNCSGVTGATNQGGFGPTGGTEGGGFAGDVQPTTPPGTPLSAEEEAKTWALLEEREAKRRAAAGLPKTFSENERRAILGILASEGGHSGGNLATLLNRSYYSKSPASEVVFADRQFTPATGFLTGYNDIVAGNDQSGFRRFTGGYYSAATTSLSAALNNSPSYEELLNQGVTHFNARSLGAKFGAVVLDSGNLYQRGGGAIFNSKGQQNEQKFFQATANLRT